MQPALQNNAVSKHLKGKRIVLASASPRRKEILEECLGWTGFEVIPSTFDETLPHADYVGREEEYPVDTAAEKVCALSRPLPHSDADVQLCRRCKSTRTKWSVGGSVGF